MFKFETSLYSMIKTSKILFFIFLLPSFIFAQKTVGIFYAGLRLEEPLVNDIKTANPANNVANRYVKKALFPQYLLDSLHKEVLSFSNKITGGSTKYIYKISTSQDTIFTKSGGEIEGFPRNSKKNALLSGCDEYLDIRFTMLSRGGSEIKMPSGKPSHYKPSLLVSISNFDKNGELLKKYNFDFTEFYWKEKLKKSVYVKQVVDRRSTLLHPEDLYILFRKGMEMTEEKIANNE
jgi:hypothetical protein